MKLKLFLGITIILILIIQINSAQPLLIAHQGGEYWEENNFSYIENSIKEGANIIELDIRLKKEEYVIKHFWFSKNQGKLSNALTKVNNASLYIDIKDEKINPNDLIKYIRKTNNNKIIIGSFKTKILKKIEKDKNITINYHCFSFLCSIKKAKELDADWINPVSYFITKNKIKEIQDNGFKFVPAGNEDYKKQLKYIELGAYATSTYKIKEFKNFLNK